MGAPAATARSGHASSRARGKGQPKSTRRRSGAAARAKASAAKTARAKAAPRGAKTSIRGLAITRAGAVALPRPGVVTRPRKPAARPRTAVRRAPAGRFVGTLDRVLRGPGYIALVGVLLAGIVFFNVDVLQVNHGIAQTGVRAEALKRENAVLTRELAKLASTERIQEAAAARGLVLPPPGDVRYLKARGDDSRRALRTMTAPESTTVTPPPAPQPAAPEPQVVAPVPETAPVSDTGVTPAQPVAPATQQTTQTTPPVQQQPVQPPVAATGGGTQATG